MARHHRGSSRPRTVLIGSLLLASGISAGCATSPHRPPAVPADASLGEPVQLQIDTRQNSHPISPLIYGLNYPDPALAAELELPLQRWGGNSTSRYNWRTGGTNLASDWFFENETLRSESTLERFLADTTRRGSQQIVTVPMIGWVAAPSVRKQRVCSFPVAVFGPQDATDPYEPLCGNGLRDGLPVGRARPTGTSLAAGTEYAQSFTEHVAQVNGPATATEPRYYSLDNEPGLWHETHRDVHPYPVTRAELNGLSAATAAAIKAGDPGAAVMGPSDWGWCALFFSAQEKCGQRPLPQPEGTPKEALPHYLTAMREASDKAGMRLLDVLDEHYYPQAKGVALKPAGDAETQALRLRSTRSLWDPGYVDESWIGRDVKAEPIALIPRLKEWVSTYYPGTKVGISEYNFGGLESMNGALAQADVLGIFGREGLDLAALWSPPKPSEPGAFALRMYRNFDGKNAKFGDVSLESTSSDRDRLALYAARRSADGALTVVVINKSGEAIEATTQVDGFSTNVPARRFTYSPAQPTRIVESAPVRMSTDSWTTAYPASSITVLEFTGPWNF